jgi:hypothetical protein
MEPTLGPLCFLRTLQKYPAEASRQNLLCPSIVDTPNIENFVVAEEVRNVSIAGTLVQVCYPYHAVHRIIGWRKTPWVRDGLTLTPTQEMSGYGSIAMAIPV